MGEEKITPKGLEQILKEDASLKEKYTYQEFMDKKSTPRNSDSSVEEVYEDYKKIKSRN